jgi:hypothetical protein
VLRVQPTGVRSYNVAWGTKRILSIGKVGELPPDEARELAGKVLGNVRLGRNPWHGLKGESAGPTLGAFVTETYEPRLRARNPKTADDTISRLKAAFGDWYLKPLACQSARLRCRRRPHSVVRGPSRDGRPRMVRVCFQPRSSSAILKATRPLCGC